MRRREEAERRPMLVRNESRKKRESHYSSSSSSSQLLFQFSIPFSFIILFYLFTCVIQMKLIHIMFLPLLLLLFCSQQFESWLIASKVAADFVKVKAGRQRRRTEMERFETVREEGTSEQLVEEDTRRIS